MYGVLSFQLMRGCVRQYKSWKLRYNATTFALTVTVCYGGVIELYQQYFLTDRYGDWVDMAANVVGAILGVVVFRIIFSEYIR
jgi:VanZ family protein